MTNYCDVYFVRHGETKWNFQKRIQGHTDIPLNATGIAQALHVKQILSNVSFSTAFSSDLSRAQHTAELIIQPRTIPITTSTALRERSAGLLEGTQRESLEQKIRPFLLSKQALQQKTYLHSAWHPELETMHSVYNRVTDFLFPLIAQQLGKSILVVSHGGVLRSILDHLCFIPKKRWVVDNCGFIQIRIEQQKWQLMNHHGVSHQLYN